MRSWPSPTSSSPCWRTLPTTADDARLRALVSETPLAGQEHTEAQRHADAMARHREDVLHQLAELEKQQDDLLDRLLAEPSR